jgi:prepilin-type N-terminal cleavage/methylation domain-containing protein
MKPYSRGFTLIEMSMVLVIIGLFAGSILMGRELIRVAQVRRQITQIEQFNTAVYVFKNKYHGMAGDIEADKAESFGFAERSGARGHGDGNEQLESCDPESADVNLAISLGCENILFWADLSAARLIKEDFSATTDSVLTSATPDETLRYVPATEIASRFGRGGIVAVTEASGRQRFVMLRYVAFTGDWSGVGPGINSADAFSLDSKMDDGKPYEGKVLAVNPMYGVPVIPGWYTVSAQHNSLLCTSAGDYIVKSSAPGLKACSLSFPIY